MARASVDFYLCGNDSHTHMHMRVTSKEIQCINYVKLLVEEAFL